MSNKIESVWDYADNAPAHATETAALWNWSLNCEHPTPFALFLDIIGYSKEHFGEKIATDISDSTMGYTEQSYLADALQEYSSRPQDVEKWITELLEWETK